MQARDPVVPRAPARRAWQGGMVSVPDWLAGDERAIAIRHRDRTAGRRADWPVWCPDEVRTALQRAGIESCWQHQAEVAQAAWSGRHVAVSTPTASGKSLGYLLPVLAATAVPASRAGVRPGNDLRSRLGLARHTALYLAPTKSLAHDQRAAATRLGPPGWLTATVDGDSTPAERRFAREHAGFVLSNPDLLHHSLLPNHAKWSRFLGSLRYVIVDEAHRYRGVFGAQTAQVLRRLRRLCARYGADPTFILASATCSAAGRTGARLIGEPQPLVEVNQDWAPHAARNVVLWRPGMAAGRETSWLLARLVDEGLQTIAFVASRQQAEVVALQAGQQIESGRRVASYRAGYLAADRRKLEEDLRQGRLAGVAATNALELGVDIAGLDAVVINGFPGTLASFWQQAGRAGRGARDALVVLVAGDDLLDAHLLAHPELIFDRPVEQTVLFPDNPRILGPQLTAAAAELPLTGADERWFGPAMGELADRQVTAGRLRRRPTGWFWAGDRRAGAGIELRGDRGSSVEIVERATGRVIGQVDRSAADRTVHPGAVYLHQGEQWLVTDYSPAERVALVVSGELPYHTQALVAAELRIVAETDSRALGLGRICLGEVELTDRVLGFLRRDALSGRIWDQTPLDLPERSMRTQAVWLRIADEVAAALSGGVGRLAGAVHAAEHTAIGLLPVFAPCDRWDIGGLSSVAHPDAGGAAIFIHDGLAGGAGFAVHGFEVAGPWWLAAWERLRDCDCGNGCPKCCVSPKCGTGNQPLDRPAAAELLGLLLAA